MNRQQKEVVVDRLRDKFAASGAAVIVQYKGLTVKEMRNLRHQLREQGGALQVAKARLMRRAAGETSKTQDLLPFFKNQIGLVFAPSVDLSPMVLKVLADFSKNHEAFSIIAGSLQERVFEGPMLVQLANLPSRAVLLARVASVLQAPMRGVVVSLNQIILRLIWALKQVQDRKS